MSRFTDYDTFLNAQQHARNDSHTQKRERLLQARKKFDTLISEIFKVTKEYHETIILPRTDSVLILKKQEPTDSSFSFLYRANLVPTDFLPPAFRATDIVERVDYMNPKEITKHDWHANVALQVSLVLTHNEEDTAPRVTMNILVWGDPNNEQTVLPNSVSLKTDMDKRTSYTNVTLVLSDENMDRFVTEFENLLMALTPQVITHRDIVWKK